MRPDRYIARENFGISIVVDTKERRTIAQTWAYVDALNLASALNAKDKRRTRFVYIAN